MRLVRYTTEIRTFTRDAPLPFPLAAKLEGATKELRNAQTSVRELDDAALATLQQDSADGGAPPPATQRVFEAACLVLGVKVSAAVLFSHTCPEVLSYVSR
jgi:hypothetical protein